MSQAKQDVAITRESLLSRAAGFLFGYDFFISYAQSDGLEYAQNLAARLQDDGFECFLDRKSFVKGENWRMAGRRALNKTQRLVLIASPNALRSEPVLMELEIFTAKGKRVIPIDFGGTLDRNQYDSPLFKHISEDDLFIPESPEQLDSGHPSDHVVSDLGRSFKLERQNKKRLRWLSIACVVFMLLTIASVVLTRIAYDQWHTAITMQGEAEESARHANRQLATVEFVVGTNARAEHSSNEAAHHFYRAAEAARLAEDESRSQSYLISAAHESRQNQITATFLNSSAVNGVVFNANGTRILTWCDDGTARLWDITQPAPLRVFEHVATTDATFDGIDGPRVDGAMFVANNSRVITWGKTHARVWDLTDLQRKRPLREFEGHVMSANEGGIISYEYVPTGGRLLSLWSLDEDSAIQMYSDDNEWITAAVLGNESHRFITWYSDMERIDDKERNGRRALSERGSVIKLWDATQSAPLCTYELAGSIVREGDVLLSPDESHFIFLTGGDVRMGSFNSVESLGSLTTFHHGLPLSGAQFSADAERLLTWGAEQVRVWDVSDINRIKPLHTYHSEGGFEGAEFGANDRRILTWSKERTVDLWDASQEEDVRQDTEITQDKGARAAEPLSTFLHDVAVDGAVLSDDGTKIVTWSINGLDDSGSAFLWDVGQGGLINTYQTLQRINGARVSGDNRHLLIWCNDGSVGLWDAGVNKPRVFEHQESVNGAGFNSSETYVLTWSDDRTAILWDVSRDHKFRPFHHEGAVIGAAFSTNESCLLTWSSDGSARLWNVKDEKQIQRFQHGGAMIGAAFSADSSVLLTWGKLAVRLWDVNTGVELHTFRQEAPIPFHEALFVGAALSANGERVLTWTGDVTIFQNDTAQLWDVGRNDPVQTFKHNGPVRGAMFSADESRVLTWSANVAEVWDVNTAAKPLHRLHHDNDKSVSGAVFSANESRVLTWSDDRTARLWDVDQDECLRTFQHDGPVRGAVFSADESRVLTWSGDGTARLWDVGQNELLRTFQHENSVFGAVFSTDESRVLTWSTDDTARLWDVGQDEPLRIFQHESDVSGAVFSADERRVLTWSDDGTARLWDVSFDAETPIADQIRQYEIRTGTTIDGSGRLRVLSYDEWISRISEENKTDDAP